MTDGDKRTPDGNIINFGDAADDRAKHSISFDGALRALCRHDSAAGRHRAWLDSGWGRPDNL